LISKIKRFSSRKKTSLSLYELSSSGLVSSLFKIFPSSNEINLSNERAKLFCLIFLSDDQSQAFHILIQKLISILESIEKLPLFLYNTPSNYSLQIFSKRFRFQLHYQNQQQLFTGRTRKSLKIEHLATVGQLQTFLASMVKNFIFFMFQNNGMIILNGHLEFVKRLKSDGRQHFTYINDFDQNGILYWIGRNALTVSDYTNPNSTGLVSVTCSDNNCISQQLSEMISHTPHSDDDENNSDINRGYSWILIDLGLIIIPTYFT
jgi:E3 ubiquitin-protein ligase HECTD1